MKTAIKFILTVGVVAASFSCNEDLLNPIPKTTFSEAVVFNTPWRLEQVLYGRYAKLKPGQVYGGRLLVYNDIRAEEFLNRTTKGVTGLATWQHSVLSSTYEVQDLWSAGYLAINRANVFIKGVNEHPEVLEASVAQNYIAQARVIRGLVYFSLLQLYARPYAENNGASPGLPLRLLPELSDE